MPCILRDALFSPTSILATCLHVVAVSLISGMAVGYQSEALYVPKL